MSSDADDDMAEIEDLNMCDGFTMKPLRLL